MTSPRFDTKLTFSRPVLEALNAFGAAVLGANSVNEWAQDSEPFPYYYARMALEEALITVFGEEQARRIRDIHSEITEPISNCIAAHYGHNGLRAELFVVDCACGGINCPLDHEPQPFGNHQ